MSLSLFCLRGINKTDQRLKEKNLIKILKDLLFCWDPFLKKKKAPQVSHSLLW